MNLTPSEKLMFAIFGEGENRFSDYPILVTQRNNAILAELSLRKGRGGDITPREERVLLLRFGFDSGRARTLEEVGKEFGLSRDRIRQIEAKALRKLRHPYHSQRLKGLWYQPTKDDISLLG